MLKLSFLTAALAVSAGTMISSGADRNSGRVPVLLELFTSEGCSSCPPADRLLEVFDQKQPIAGAELIVLSEHVDYWDRLGWKDPFSSPRYSARQQQYNKADPDGVYTPQLVVDGRFRFVGSEQREASAAIQNAIREPKIPIAISKVAMDGQQVRARIELPAADRTTRSRRGALYVALAYNRTESHVARGENAGRALAHVAVTRILQQVSTIDLQSATATDVTLTLPRENEGGGLRIITFVQDPASGHVLGVAAGRL